MKLFTAAVSGGFSSAIFFDSEEYIEDISDKLVLKKKVD